RARERRPQEDRQCQRNPDHDAERESEQNLCRRYPTMKQEKRHIGDEGDGNGAGRRQEKGRDLEQARSCLPDDEYAKHDCDGIEYVADSTAPLATRSTSFRASCWLGGAESGRLRQ